MKTAECEDRRVVTAANLRALAAAALGCYAAFAAALVIAAEAPYPSKPIRFILPFPPGSGTDTGARLVAKHITEVSGQPVIVDNRAGGNGLIAAQAAAQAPKDGYTVFVTTMSTQSVNLALYKKLPYDPQRDFTAVTLFTLSPMLLIVRNADDQPKTVAELAERIRKSPTPLTYASGNTSSQVAAASFLALLGATGTHVPYKGTPQGITDLLSGRNDFFFPDLTPSVPLVQQGRLRALAVTGKNRIGSMPELATMAEAGFPVNLVTWSGAFVPAGTPRPVVTRLYEMMRGALTGSEYQAHTKRLGTLAGGIPPEEFEAFVKDEVAVWGNAVRAAGIQPE